MTAATAAAAGDAQPVQPSAHPAHHARPQDDGERTGHTWPKSFDIEPFIARDAAAMNFIEPFGHKARLMCYE